MSITSEISRIAESEGMSASVRADSQLARVIAKDPSGSSILFLSRLPTAARQGAFLTLDFESPHPVIDGRTVDFVHPARLKGKQGSFDFERDLGVQGTAPSARVVHQILARMSNSDNS